MALCANTVAGRALAASRQFCLLRLAIAWPCAQIVSQVLKKSNRKEKGKIFAAATGCSLAVCCVDVVLESRMVAVLAQLLRLGGRPVALLVPVVALLVRVVAALVRVVASRSAPGRCGSATATGTSSSCSSAVIRAVPVRIE